MHKNYTAKLQKLHFKNSLNLHCNNCSATLALQNLHCKNLQHFTTKIALHIQILVCTAVNGSFLYLDLLVSTFSPDRPFSQTKNSSIAINIYLQQNICSNFLFSFTQGIFRDAYICCLRSLIFVRCTVSPYGLGFRLHTYIDDIGVFPPVCIFKWDFKELA